MIALHQQKIWDDRSMSTNVYAKFRCALLRIKKALGIFRELITTTTRRTTRVAFWDPSSGQKKQKTRWFTFLGHTVHYIKVFVCCRYLISRQIFITTIITARTVVTVVAGREEMPTSSSSLWNRRRLNKQWTTSPDNNEISTTHWLASLVYDLLCDGCVDLVTLNFDLLL